MIEVLVALVILSFGALGAAAMQVTSKKANHDAQQRFTATYLTNGIIEKMRNNPGALVTYAGADVGGNTIAAEPGPNCSAGNVCNSVELASHDRWVWEQSIDGAAVQIGGTNTGGLVQPTGCIFNNAGRIQVVISWWGSEETSDAGAGANGVAVCGVASSHRRQLVVKTFIILTMNHMMQSITIHQRHRASGLTLVELMIASVLGLVIVGTVMYLFLSSKLAFSETARLGAINENGRYAMSALTEELRLVDFWGETRSLDISNDADLAAIGTDCVGDADANGNGFANGYGHVNALWANTAGAATVAVCITDAVVNSDVVFIKHVAATPTPLAALVANRNYLMANDSKGVLFNQADASPPTDVVGGDVPGGTVWEYIISAYYVRSVAGNPPTLFRKRLIGNVWENPGEEVALGIERLHLQFGIDNNNDAVADFFVNSANVAAAWGTVVSVRLFLLVRSETSDPNYTNEKTYQLGNVAFGGVSVTPNDSFNRTLFDTSVSLRNRRLLIAGGF